MKDHEIFKGACYAPDVNAFFQKLIDDKVHTPQYFDYAKDGVFVKELFSIGIKCRHCKQYVKEEDFAIAVGYWANTYFPCHKQCVKEQKREETIACQTIDADCNDCKHFEREKSLGEGMASGNCKKFNKQTKAYANMATGMPCFEHRLST